MSEAPTQSDAPDFVDVTMDSASRTVATVAAPDFTLDKPAGADATATDLNARVAGADNARAGVTGDSAVPMAGAIDFNFDLPATAPEGGKHDSTIAITPENQDKATGLNMDFDLGIAAVSKPAGGARADESDTLAPPLKLDDISLNLDDAPAAPAAGGAKDDHWYDVQTKFDLAKAYQEMGDKDGAREILQEVIKEGDAAQQAEAKQLLDTLG
jgi:pilus assembly protein FimV